MKSKIIIAIVFLVGGYLGLLAFKNQRYSRESVTRHSGLYSCWTVINGTVYDLTSLISTHSGGEKAILSICGKDGSFLFNKRHGSDADVKSELEVYKVGTVSQ